MAFILPDNDPERTIREGDLDWLAEATFAIKSCKLQARDDVEARLVDLSTVLDESIKSVTRVRSSAKMEAQLTQLKAALEERSEHFGRAAESVQQCWEWRSMIRERCEGPEQRLLMQCVTREPHQVLPRLWVGGYFTAADRSELEHLGVTHVCCCVAETPRFPDVFEYAVVPLEDNVAFDPLPYFDRATAFIEEGLARGGRVYVHCGSGVSRAPIVVAALLMRLFQLSDRQALDYIRRVRPPTHPNAGFIKRLAEYRVMLQQHQQSPREGAGAAQR